MGRMESTSFLLMVAIVSFFMLQQTNALIHVVGGPYGWDIPPTPNFYCQWTSHRTFGVGDQLVFPYRPASADVFEVPKQAFDTCTRDHIINQWMVGPTTVTLDKPGDYYFFSSVGTHCEMGQKLHVVVGSKPGSDGVNWNLGVQHPMLGIHNMLHVAHDQLPVVHNQVSTIHPLPVRKLLSHSPDLRSEESLT